MVHRQHLIVRNLKVSFKTVSNSHVLTQFANAHIKNTDIKPSFFVVRCHRFVFCIYFKGHINITGLCHVREICQCATIIKLIPGIHVITACQVDNITCTGALGYTIPQFYQLLSFLNSSSQNDFLRIKYSQETFAGAQLKSRTGTIILFMSGKFNIVGCKRYVDACLLADTLYNVLKQYFNHMYPSNRVYYS